jgi:hypothetical protein
MGHGDEPMPEEVIEDLRDQVAQLTAEVEKKRGLPPRPAKTVPKLIHQKLIEVMREVTFVAKTGMNTQQNYPFRGIDGVMNEVGPAMRKVGVLAIPTVLQYKNRDTYTTGDKKTREVVMEVRYDFYAEDGSSVSTVVWGESLDFSDKGTAKALSVALRQALLQTLMLPTQEPTTDDNGHYHTRSGTPTLSGWTASYGRAMIDHGEMDEVVDFWTAVVESSSIEAPIGGGEDLTWGEGIAARIAGFVAEEKSPEELRELYGWLKAADMLGLWHVDAAGQRHMLGDLVIERGKQAKLNRDKAFDHCMRLITEAADLEALDNARVHIRVDAEEGSITREQLADLMAVAADRSDKLTTELNQPAPREYLPPVGETWNIFVEHAQASHLTENAIRELIDGRDDVPAASYFGFPGWLRVLDAIKRSHRRDETINDAQRENLTSMVIDMATEDGIVIPDANL